MLVEINWENKAEELQGQIEVERTEILKWALE
jgi:hypothetical protein